MKDQNISAGFIGTQVDKTIDALNAFLDLYQNPPMVEADFEETRKSLVGKMRTTPLPYRDILDNVLAWAKLDLKIDPRRKWFRQLQKSDLATIQNFHTEHIKDRARLISIVGKKANIDLEKLKSSAK